MVRTGDAKKNEEKTEHVVYLFFLFPLLPPSITSHCSLVSFSDALERLPASVVGIRTLCYSFFFFFFALFKDEVRLVPFFLNFWAVKVAWSFFANIQSEKVERCVELFKKEKVVKTS